MSVKVHLEGDGLLFDDETTPFNAAQIIGFLKNSETLSGQSSALSSVSPVMSIARPRISPRQALTESGAKTNPQKIVVLGKYQMDLSTHEGFTLDEVKSAYKRSGEPMPKNFSRDAQTAVDLDLMFREDENSDMYVLSDKALEYLQTGFPEQDKARVTLGRRDKVTRRGGSSARLTLNEELLGQLKDHNGSLQQFIWERQSEYDKGASSQVAILATWLFDELKYDGISPSDLKTIRSHRGEPAGNPGSQLNNAKNRDGYFQRVKEGKFELSQKGEDYGRIHSKG